MRFLDTPLKDARLVDLELWEDHRGHVARVWCKREFKTAGLDAETVQTDLSYNHYAGTLRGMHMQAPPYEQAKLIWCVSGGIHDVIIDMRESSPTYERWFGVSLTSWNQLALYVPKGFAHGYQTLHDRTTVIFQVSVEYHPEAERGLRYDDPAFGIMWPLPVSEISVKDSSLPLLGQFAEVPA
jgi:dTDP-4-dehydrorhamnose 3,5-epimerase